MGDILKGIEFLGIPTTIGIILVGILLMSQIIGEISELLGKTVPEILKIRKIFTRKKQEKEDTAKTLAEVKQLLSDVNSHYSKDNITKRNNWMNEVDKSVRDNDKLIQALDGKIDKLLENNENLNEVLKEINKTPTDLSLVCGSFCCDGIKFKTSRFLMQHPACHRNGIFSGNVRNCRKHSSASADKTLFG